MLNDVIIVAGQSGAKKVSKKGKKGVKSCLLPN
jgi:hypothetical protein